MMFPWAVYYKKTVHKFQLARSMYKPTRQISDPVPTDEHLNSWCLVPRTHPTLPQYILSLRVKKNKTKTEKKNP